MDPLIFFISCFTDAQKVIQPISVATGAEGSVATRQSDELVGLSPSGGTESYRRWGHSSELLSW